MTPDLDELDRLEKAIVSLSDEALFRSRLAEFWRSGGREMVRDGERWREYLSHHAADQREAVTTAIDTARRTSGDERG